MKSHLFRRRCIAFVLIIAMLAVSAWVVMPAPADAQASDELTMTLAVSAPDDAGYQTLALAIDPGASAAAGIDGYLTYDPSLIDVVDCAVSEAGACHDVDGTVRFSVFNLAGIRASAQLVTVDFVFVESAVGFAEFGGGTTAVFNTQVEELAAVEVAPVQIETSIAAGSVTGEVLDEATQVGLYDIDVCVLHVVTEAEYCTSSTGLGNWRLDEVPAGEYIAVFTDASGRYTRSSTSLTIVADQITTGLVALLGFPGEAESGEAVSEEDAAENESATDNDDLASENYQESPPVTDDENLADTTQSDGWFGREFTPVSERRYQASISGVVVAFESGTGVEAIHVCATQPLVLHQSCSTTQADGTFVLSGISTGNYWLTAVDPLAQLVEVGTELVGVVGANAERDGVRLVLVPAR